jgi:hypothetical protein
MANNVLTEEEAAIALRCDEDDPNLLELLPLVDAYLKQATGRDWANDDPVPPEAKSAARLLLIQMHENPGGLPVSGQMTSGLTFGLPAALLQLKVLGMELVETA